MKNEFQMENNVLEINNFLTHSETSQIQHHTFYWDWPLQSGITEAEQELADEEDTKFMNTQMSVGINVTGKQAQETVGRTQITYDYNYFEDDLLSESEVLKNSYSYNTSATFKNQTELIDNMNAKYGKEIKITVLDTDGGTATRGMFLGKNLEIGTTYTWSVFLRSNEAQRMRIGYEDGGLRNGVTVNDNWTRFTHTFTVIRNRAFNFYNYGQAWDANDTLEIHSLEIREGDSLNTKTETKLINSELGTLLIPKREGYTFDGWYTSPAGGEKITSQTKVTENATYYAHWIYNN